MMLIGSEKILTTGLMVALIRPSTMATTMAAYQGSQVTSLRSIEVNTTAKAEIRIFVINLVIVCFLEYSDL